MIERKIDLIYEGAITAKKNRKRIVTNQWSGKPMIISNQQAKDQEQAMASEFFAQAKQRGWIPEDKYVEYHVEIYINNPDHRRRDLDNQVTAILDALVLGGVIPDDSSKYVTYIAAHSMGVSPKPKAEIEVTSFSYGRKETK